MSIDIFHKIKDFFLKNEQKIVLIVAFCLITAISFEFGVLKGQKWQQKPLVIEKTINIPADTQSAQNGASGAPASTPASTLQASQVPVSSTASTTNCAFVGSKNSNKFYPPTCSYAKRIKPENVVCFKNANEALAQGRIESKCAN